MKKRKVICLIEIALMAWFAVFTFLNGDAQSFWIDELSTVGYIRHGLSLREMFHIYLYLDTNLPLYSLILYFWYRIFPYGEQFLLIPSIVFCMGGIILLGKSVERLKGERAGFVAFCLGCSSNAIIWQGAWEARCYSLVFLLSAFTMWAYINKVIRKDKKSLFLYGLVCLLFLWTHWFACIVLAFYGLADLVLVFRKKFSWKILLCYPVGLLSFLPWFVISFISKGSELDGLWTQAPEWKNMFWTVLFYVSGKRILWYVCLITGALICASALWNAVKKKKEGCVEAVLGCLFTLSIGWTVGIVFVYSYYIFPQGSLYVERYFMVVAPHILLVTAWGLDWIVEVADKGTSHLHDGALKKAVPFVIRGLVGLLLCGYFIACYKESYTAIRKPWEEYRQLVDYVIGEGRIWDDNTALIGSNRYCALDGLVDYYFVKRGYEEPANVIDSGIHGAEESRFYKNYSQWTEEELLKLDRIYCVRIHMGCEEALASFLDKNFRQVPVDENLGLEVWERKLQ